LKIKPDNTFLGRLEKSILDLVGDITANNKFEIMDNQSEPEHAITHIIEGIPGNQPIKQKARGILQEFKKEFRKRKPR